MPELTPIKILCDAAAELDRNGWKRNGFGTANGPKCALGALHFAATGDVYAAPRLPGSGAAGRNT